VKRARPWAVLAAALLVPLTACAPAGDDSAVPAPEQGQPAAPEPDGDDEGGADTGGPLLDAPGIEDLLPPEETDPQPVGALSRAPRESDDYPRWGGDPVQIVDARLLELPGIDRFVLEFDGPVPSWQVRLVEGPILEQPGRAEIDLAGDSHLELRVVPATSIDRDAAEPMAAYQGPSLLDAPAPGLLEAALTGDRSDVLTWVLGMQGDPDVAVAALEDPSRIVVDVVVR
jgi:hypothetical protein